MTSRPRRIAVLKPDFGVHGGFERVVDQVEATLRADGHDVTRLTVAVNELPHRPFGVPVPDDVWAIEPEYFRYLASVEAFDRLDTRRYDAVVSTQPPSFTHRHPRHLALFFHHHRIFYDLEDAYLAAGFAADPAVHARAGELVRELDQPRLERSAGSSPAPARCATAWPGFNGRTNVSVYHAGVGVDGDEPLTPALAAPGVGPVLCVGRHEFPKRTELVVQAAHLLPGTRFALVGTGGREAWARPLDHRLSPARDRRRRAHRCRAVAQHRAGRTGGRRRGFRSNVEFLGRVDDPTLGPLYRDAPCVVAPALEEDYGLTAIEAMRHGRPVVVCTTAAGWPSWSTTGSTVSSSSPPGGRSPRRSSGWSPIRRSPPSSAPTVGPGPPPSTWAHADVRAPRRAGPGAGMKVAIIAPSPVPFTRGGAERAVGGLARAINEHTPHECELVKLPVDESTLAGLVDGYEAFSVARPRPLRPGHQREVPGVDRRPPQPHAC